MVRAGQRSLRLGIAWYCLVCSKSLWSRVETPDLFTGQWQNRLHECLSDLDLKHWVCYSWWAEDVWHVRWQSLTSVQLTKRSITSRTEDIHPTGSIVSCCQISICICLPLWRGNTSIAEHLAAKETDKAVLYLTSAGDTFAVLDSKAAAQHISFLPSSYRITTLTSNIRVLDSRLRYCSQVHTTSQLAVNTFWRFVFSSTSFPIESLVLQFVVLQSLFNLAKSRLLIVLRIITCEWHWTPPTILIPSICRALAPCHDGKRLWNFFFWRVKRGSSRWYGYLWERRRRYGAIRWLGNMNLESWLSTRSIYTWVIETLIATTRHTITASIL